MTEVRQPPHEQFAENVHPFRSSVTRATTIRPKLASVDETGSQGE
jgi:hypothetical protein